ncbi:CLUMA_CG021231, isoform A [Clunio marinus]|uniref:Dystroglycan 1 n=1 Tax=Clunio marinus TaxID=568069 RepID=A0A1J1JAH6_9DIPT|nr:CLUMA_CG021231, isoform A [Clunio marinus]
MISKRRISTVLLVLFCGTFVATQMNDDFKFEADDLQIVNSDPTEAIMKTPSRYLYAKEVAQCPSGESKTILTLLLKSLRWSDVSERKKEKAIKKLSRFFMVPRQFITVSDIHTSEILEMLKHSINKSNNLLNTKESVARIEFMIGCGDKLFSNGKTIAHQINEQVKEGGLDELSGLPFNWWNIWAKHVKSRVQRTRRQTDGSGNYEDDEYYEDIDEEGDENEDEEEEDSIPEEDTIVSPRSRHYQHKKNSSKRKQKKISVAQVQDEPSMNTEESERDVIAVEIPQMAVEESQSLPAETETTLLELEQRTQRPVTVETAITPIDVIENIKLESYVNKTIVNDNNVVDVPIYQDKDQILEEVKKIIAEPPTESTTTVAIETEEYISITPQHVYIPDTSLGTTSTTAAPTTLMEEEITTKTSTLTTDAVVSMATTPITPEAETIFVPIITKNNENIIYDEKSSIVTTTDSSMLEDVITEQAYETSTHTPITSTSTTSSTTKTSTEILTTTTEPPTSTFRIVDVTLMVDKISQATTNAEENEIDEKTESRSNVREEKKKPEEESESNYDDEYDDTLPEENVVDVESAAPTTTTQAPTTVTTPRRTTFRVTTPEIIEYPSTTDEEVEESAPSTVPARSTDAVTSEAPSLSVSSEPPIEAVDYEDANIPPRVDRRIQKSAATAGKPFVIKIDENVFYDEEDKTDLTLKLLTKAGQLIPASSWIRYDPEKREIYGLPLESDVSRYEFKLRATDSYGDYVDENVDITVQQYKGYRSANHEIYIQVKLEKNYESPVDWQIRLVRGLVEALDDESTASVIVREVRPNKYESNMFTFVYTNETLPKDHCPKEELEQLMTSLTKQALNEVMRREITVRNVEKDLVGSCQETVTPKVYSIPTNTKNFPPTVRNPVDLVPAYVGQLLVFEVPKDTFHDPEDFTDLKLTLLHGDRTKLEPNHWLQFDAKNREFYGVPSITDKTQQYILVAEDKSGLHTNDALVVEIKNGNYKRDHSATFEYQLDVDEYQFSHAATKRKFIEGVARVFQDSDTSHILLKMVKRIQYAGRTAVVLQNSTLYRHRECPHNEINKLQNILLHPDKSVRDEVKATIGNDFNVQKITVAPSGKCAAGDGHHHPEEITPRPEDQETPIINQDVLVTYVLPSAIILLMLLIALLIACLLYKRRNTGKMELGDEEERKSFRSKGIPVIFQDELEEKPEIVTKSPIILKDEKPPLLPQYNGLNNEGDDDNMDQYIPPQPLLMGSRESRGKSPVTPSYRKPPPYVSP